MQVCLHYYLIIMYHPGKVLDVFPSRHKDVDSADISTQAMLEMWDENLITVLVDAKLSLKLKKEDIVLVDYTPMDSKPVPKLTVIKVLKGKTAKDTWKTYKDHHRARKSGKLGAPMPALRIEQPQTPQAYVG